MDCLRARHLCALSARFAGIICLEGGNFQLREVTANTGTPKPHRSVGSHPNYKTSHTPQPYPMHGKLVPSPLKYPSEISRWTTPLHSAYMPVRRIYEGDETGSAFRRSLCRGARFTSWNGNTRAAGRASRRAAARASGAGGTSTGRRARPAGSPRRIRGPGRRSRAANYPSARQL
jgi:hypothetical protein